jgi:hypothetical protein
VSDEKSWAETLAAWAPKPDSPNFFGVDRSRASIERLSTPNELEDAKAEFEAAYDRLMRAMGFK